MVYHMKMKTSPNDVSNQEILEALNAFAGSVDERFEEIKTVMVTKDDLKTELSRFATKDDLQGLKTTMVTKGYLDDKLADHHSDIILHVDRKIEKALR